MNPEPNDRSQQADSYLEKTLLFLLSNNFNNWYDVPGEKGIK